MSDERQPDDGDGASVNRRSVLKGIGATAASTAGFSSSAAASIQGSDQASREKYRKAVNSDEVQSILEELGNPKILNSAEAEIENEEDDVDFTLSYVLLFLKAGTIVYTEASSGHTDAKFRFGLGRDDLPGLIGEEVNGERSRGSANDRKNRKGRGRSPGKNPNALARKYRSVPAGTNAMLIAKEHGGTLFRRGVTDAEHELVEAELGRSVEKDHIVTGEDIDGFIVSKVNDEGDEPRREETTLVADVETDATRPLTEQVSAFTRVTDEEFSTQDHEIHPCFGVCLSCGAAGLSCAGCVVPCAGSPTGVGLFACAVCLFGVCHGVLLAACAACAVCLDNHPP